jgi:hypothetical protein
MVTGYNELFSLTLHPSHVKAPKWKPAAGSPHTLHCWFICEHIDGSSVHFRFALLSISEAIFSGSQSGKVWIAVAMFIVVVFTKKENFCGHIHEERNFLWTLTKKEISCGHIREE